MSERVIDRVMEMAGQLREQGAEAEKIGQLTDQTTKAMKAAGNIRLLQPTKYSGYEVHPREFAETVMATASLDPAAGSCAASAAASAVCRRRHPASRRE